MQSSAPEIAIFVDKLEHPWGMAELPGGGLLVTERAGRLRHVSADGALSEPIKGLPNIWAGGQGGMLDVAIGPTFADDRLIYWTYAKATPDNIEAGIAWIDALELEFETNVYDALELAFLLAGRGVDDRYYDSNVDTIFFLSDGAPTIPKYNQRGIRRDDPGQILQAVRRWNALYRVTVHTIGIGLRGGRRGGRGRNQQNGASPIVFLQRLAEQNQGRHVLKR